jgi:hypothetical protein
VRGRRWVMRWEGSWRSGVGSSDTHRLGDSPLVPPRALHSCR